MQGFSLHLCHVHGITHQGGHHEQDRLFSTHRLVIELFLEKKISSMSS